MDQKKTLTIFTPAYNRAHTLGRTYGSLCRQTSSDFVWLIVDDGSTDGTAGLVKSWTGNETKFQIKYVRKENGGMHTAHNLAYDTIDTELNVCVDSDDWMPDDAVETIVTLWRENGDESLAGLIGLDCRADGSVIGTPFPEPCRPMTLAQFYGNGGRGDKKLVLRTDVVRRYPRYPVFEGERYVRLDYLYDLIGLDYKMLTVNRQLVTVEYQTDGSSNTMWSNYLRNPQGWMFYRDHKMSLGLPLLKKFLCAAHFVASAITARRFKMPSSAAGRLLMLPALPAGLLLLLYTHLQVKLKNTHKIS